MLPLPPGVAPPPPSARPSLPQALGGSPPAAGPAAALPSGCQKLGELLTRFKQPGTSAERQKAADDHRAQLLQCARAATSAEMRARRLEERLGLLETLVTHLVEREAAPAPSQ
jgi:hypothetical protein